MPNDNMTEPMFDYPTPALDNLVRVSLVAVALSVLLGVVFFCLPNRASMAKNIQKLGLLVSHTTKNASDQAKSLIAREPLKGRPCISYNDPRVRSTLDLPWAR